jgi:uncharacterized protein YcbK (DUF882 family)
MARRWRHFRLDEFRCTHSDKNFIDHRFVDFLDEFREKLGFQLVVLSGYRSPEHPLERGKKVPGWHAKGKAVDLLMPDGVAMRRAVMLALQSGVPGIGVNNRSLHLDLRDTAPVLWGY